MGLTAVAVSGLIGTLLGLVAGYYGAYVDLAIMKVVEIFLTIPFVLLALVIMALFGRGLPILIAVICLNRWIHYCRVIRGEASASPEPRGRHHFRSRPGAWCCGARLRVLATVADPAMVRQILGLPRPAEPLGPGPPAGARASPD